MFKFKNFIKQRDIFGHPIELTINNKGDSVHNTLVGGFISLLIQIAITYYVYINVLKVFTLSDDDIKSFASFLELDEVGKVYHDDLHMT